MASPEAIRFDPNPRSKENYNEFKDLQNKIPKQSR